MLRGKVLIVLSGLVLFVTACAGGDVDEGDDEGGDGGSVTVTGAWTGAEQENFEAVLEGFTEETGVDAEYKAAAGGDTASAVQTSIEGGDPPDVAMLPQPGLVQDFVDQEALRPISEGALANLDENYDPFWQDLVTIDGEVYGVYYKAANKSTWWYNLAAFQQAGVQPPSDWDQMISDGKTVVQSGVPYFSVGGADAWPLTDLWENIYLRTAGPEKYDQLAAHEIKWTDPSVIESLEIMAELFEDEKLAAGGTKGILDTTFTDSVIQTYQDPPESASVYLGDFAGSIITGDTQAQLGEDADFFPFPAIDGTGGNYVVGGGDVAVVLTDNEAAQQLVEYLATPEAAEIWASKGGFTSPNQGVDLEVYPDDITRRSAEAIVSADAFRFDLSDLQPGEFGATASRGMWLRFQEFVETLDVQETAKNLEKDATKAYS